MLIGTPSRGVVQRITRVGSVHSGVVNMETCPREDNRPGVRVTWCGECWFHGPKKLQEAQNENPRPLHARFC